MIKREQSTAHRRVAYGCDVVFCINSDLVFDYLRDRMALGHRRGRPRVLIDDLLGRKTAGSSLLLRGLHFVIIDEADSVLIDEAKTPLILSGGDDEPDTALYYLALGFARQLEAGVDYKIDESRHSVTLTARGRLRIGELVALKTW